MLNVINKKTLPVIAGVEITTDAEGRFNLNALHKASGAGSNKAPAQWLRTRSAKELVQGLIDMQKCTSPVNAVKSGENRGTFAHELLAVSYAGWISPSFQLQVNQTFIDYRTGRLTPPPQPILPSAKQLALMVIQAEEEKERLSLTVNKLEHQIFEDAPKVEFHDQVATSHGAISIAQAAKVLGTGRTRLFAFLRQISWITRRNEPYQEKIQAGLMDVKLGSWEHPERGIQERITSLLTGKGLTQLQKLWALRNQAH
ncbi:phage antirepressor KilAC domain-containing protein [Xenorhabdus sp. 42]|uniref:phage antirepressor KilAC domain-containing protein n=1 Tax=Xenorhabdus szentirmaii TaxID=290112 RepID=UPI00198BEC84|nr:phage antirepressor KilAC domain-containing protein [Xenorhabdus sp. 42]MBD2822123.1 phage antirepressor KilAC domain-containing protein [Xenorhabdus sp. 42]